MARRTHGILIRLISRSVVVVSKYFFLLCLALLDGSLLRAADELQLQGVQVVPHVQSTEMRYRREPDFSLGARVEVFLTNVSSEPLPIPPDADVQLRGLSPTALLEANQWAWHDLPSAWGTPITLPPGAMTVWSWNGSRADWGVNTQADLAIKLAESLDTIHLNVGIEPPKVWLSAVTCLGPADRVQPNSLLFHIANDTDGSLRLDACRLWLPESPASFRVLIPQPWLTENMQPFPASGNIAAHDRGGARVNTGELPLTYAALEVRLIDASGQPVTVWAHQRIKREVFDISGGWVHDNSGGGVRPLESVPIHQTLRRIHVNTAHISEVPGYTDQTAPDGLYTRYPLKYFGGLKPPEHYDNDVLLPRIHAVEFLGEPQYGGGRPVPPQECWKQLSEFAPTRLPTSVTHSEERIWRFYAGISDYPHYDAYRVTAPAADAWSKYERWGDQRIRWGAPLETIGEMSRSLRELNRPRPVAYWSQGPHHNWNGHGRRRGSPLPDELRLQAYHALSSRITSLYWFNLSLRSLVTFPDLIEPMMRIGREIRMLEDYYLEGDATSHTRVLRDGKLDWDLDVIAGPRGAVLFALDLAYEADRESRSFLFGPPRDVVFRFPLPSYVNQPAEVFRVDADGITKVDYSIQERAIEINDRVSRVAIYVASMEEETAARLEARRQALIAWEEAEGFAPDRNPTDLDILKELVEKKEP
ncbi:MAG: hypothetical protein JNL67_14590 [Planctomycetaceae bacterium]|nr:hypothetical protein [Planctomycetaceae bacterium]